ncbi:MAG: class I SAM-dependent methyltransferase [Firmicutes bacterium]|nr:class I SAM-dependent methyltransferase [Bacillota bacterium]
MGKTSVFDHIARGYDAWSRLLSADGIQRWHYDALLAMDIRPGDRVLDVGAGTGTNTLAMALKAGPSGAVVGLDPSPAMLSEAARRRLEPGSAPIQWVQGVGEALPFPDRHFDVVTAQFSLRNMDDWVQGLKEMVRVLKPDGRLVILDVVQPTLTRGVVAWRLLRRVTDLVGRDETAGYRWLGASVEHAPTGPELKAEARALALTSVYERRWLGDLVLLMAFRKTGAEQALPVTPPLPRVVWAVDGSLTALSAARLMNALLAPGTFIDIVAVMPPLVADEGVVGIDEDSWRHHVEKAESLLDGQRFHVTRYLARGDPGPAILEYALQVQASLVIVGNKGRSARADQWAGSVTRFLTQSSARPVWVVPTPHEEGLQEVPKRASAKSQA